MEPPFRLETSNSSVPDPYRLYDAGERLGSYIRGILTCSAMLFHCYTSQVNGRCRRALYDGRRYSHDGHDPIGLNSGTILIYSCFGGRREGPCTGTAACPNLVDFTNNYPCHPSMVTGFSSRPFGPVSSNSHYGTFDTAQSWYCCMNTSKSGALLVFL
ncbi:hypothetical protein BJY00DRAFT_294262 [Aspergillus carlsbadensis]|nr:hypothetical protein BJY00DRAFT_294262 [Aspergillus carlsbadensis]